jgi:shikimate dehydrogenase
MKFGLIGHPISHSLSPLLFKTAYPGINDSYELVETSTLSEAMERFYSDGFNGLNITTPYKEEITAYDSVSDETVLCLSAANTMIRKEDKIYLYNTDVDGVRGSLLTYAEKGTTALVLGFGGAGRAAAYAAWSMGCTVLVVNRSDRRRGVSWEKEISFYRPESFGSLLKSIEIVINTLPLIPPFLSDTNLSGKVVLDASYSSASLSFVRSQPGVKYIPGTYWLLYQAIESFRLFTGKEPDVNSMKLLIDNL